MNELRIVSGLHRGVSLPLDNETIVIGSSLEADIILMDPGVADIHLRIEPKADSEDTWQLTIVDPDVWDEKGNALSGSIDATMNRAFNIAGIWITFAEEATPWPKGDIAFVNQTTTEQPVAEKKSNLSYLRILIYTLPVLIGLLALTHAGDDTEEPAISIPEQTAQISAQPEVTAEELSTIFQQMLEERNLQQVQIIPSADQWRLEGSLEPEEIEKLKRMIIRFSTKYPEAIAIDNQVDTIKRNLPFTITQVVSGPYGHIKTEDGNKLYLGNEYKGVKLVAITKNTLVFSGNGEITVKW